MPKKPKLLESEPPSKCYVFDVAREGFAPVSRARARGVTTAL